jgi:hypothetical protein
MNKLHTLLLQRKIGKEMNELDELVLQATNDLDTPMSDQAMINYLREAIAWLDAGAE